MQIRRLDIKNFRGLRHATIQLPKHAVLIGDNNTGKTTILEAIDLVLGPDRLNRFPPIDEHDFFEGRYRPPPPPADSVPSGPDEQAAPEPTSDGEGPPPPLAPQIEIEATITNLSDEQRSRFGDYAEWWDEATCRLYADPDPSGVDAASISQALRVTFIGRYDPELDDFEGKTFFTRSLAENDRPDQFGTRDKQICGFLYLRSHRTGTRALSLERGSLLDIILRVKELRPQIWEATLDSLASFTVASDPKLGVSGILESINTSLKKYVPKEWGVHPHLKVSNLTRAHLRRVITAFIATGTGDHAAPFFRQGAGTINMLVLAMLSQIAEDKQNVIFAMEEPETAIPPYAQKRIVHEIRNLSAQAIFTSHSPYVLEELALEETVVLSRAPDGTLTQAAIELPPSVKLKRYRQEFRTRFCEGLLARRLLIAEGATEATAFPAVARRLSELRPETFASLEALGICTIDAGSDTIIPPLAALYGNLGKRLFAVCDKQSDESRAAIEAQVDALFMHDESSFEDLVLRNTPPEALERFSAMIEWPPHILERYPDPKADLLKAFRLYFNWSKGRWGLADFLAQCSEDEIPAWIRETCASLKELCDRPASEPDHLEEPLDPAPEAPATADHDPD